MTTAPRRRRYRVFWPLTFVFLGIGLLLAQTGWLAPPALWRLGATWPLFFIVFGVSLLLRRYLSPGATALCVTAAFLILGSGAVVYAVAGPDIGSSATFSASRPLGDVSSASLVVNASSATVDLRVGGTGGDLYAARVNGSAGARPNVSFDPGASTVTINTDNWAWWPFASSRPTTVTVTLNSSVRWAITVNGAAIDGTMDLQGAASRVQVNAAAGDVTLLLGFPQGSIPIELNGAAVNADLSVPAEVPVRVATSGVAASINVDGQTTSGIGQKTWADPVFSTAGDGYDITADGASAQVSVTHLAG